MWIIATWFVVALVVAMIFGSIARRSGDYADREITTRIAGGQHSRSIK